VSTTVEQRRDARWVEVAIDGKPHKSRCPVGVAERGHNVLVRVKHPAGPVPHQANVRLIGPLQQPTFATRAAGCLAHRPPHPGQGRDHPRQRHGDRPHNRRQQGPPAADLRRAARGRPLVRRLPHGYDRRGEPVRPAARDGLDRPAGRSLLSARSVATERKQTAHLQLAPTELRLAPQTFGVAIPHRCSLDSRTQCGQDRPRTFGR
jgi:hypothetical protein